MRDLTGIRARVGFGGASGADGTGEEIVYTDKSSPYPRLVIGEKRENGVVSKNVTSVDTK